MKTCEDLRSSEWCYSLLRYLCTLQTKIEVLSGFRIQLNSIFVRLNFRFGNASPKGRVQDPNKRLWLDWAHVNLLALYSYHAGRYMTVLLILFRCVLIFLIVLIVINFVHFNIISFLLIPLISMPMAQAQRRLIRLFTPHGHYLCVCLFPSRGDLGKSNIVLNGSRFDAADWRRDSKRLK